MVEANAPEGVTPYVGNIEAPPTRAQRDLMEDELLAQGEAYIAAMPTMKLLHEDTSIGYESRYCNDSNGHVTCTKYRVQDFDIEIFKNLRHKGDE